MLTRRDALYGLGASLGSVAFSALLAADEKRTGGPPPLPKKPHFPAKARACVFLMMDGGPSHIDTFDPKPRLAGLHLKEFTRTDPMQSAMSGGKRYYVGSPFEFVKAGRSGAGIGRRGRSAGRSLVTLDHSTMLTGAPAPQFC